MNIKPEKIVLGVIAAASGAAVLFSFGLMFYLLPIWEQAASTQSIYVTSSPSQTKTDPGYRPETITLPTPESDDNTSPEPLQQLKPQTDASPPQITIQTTTLSFVGDIMLSREVDNRMERYDDYSYPFAEMLDSLQSPDLTIGNLETPITAGPDIGAYDMVFRSDPEVTEALAQAGFDILDLANNHSGNQGSQGLEETYKHLTDNNLGYFGAGRDNVEATSPYYQKIEDITFAFVGFTDGNLVPASYKAAPDRSGTAFMDTDQLTASVQTAREYADVVIVSMHTGTEYQATPNQRQQEFARAAVDAGADLVIGHHPHVIQPVEIYQGKYIFYSLGNFVFDQMWSEATRECLVVTTTWQDTCLDKVEFTPCQIHDYSQPRAADETTSQTIMDRLDLELVDQTHYTNACSR